MQVGLERLRAEPSLAAAWGRCGLLCNQASLTAEFEPAWQVLQRTTQLTCLFSPQHGFEATVQDNMIESPHARHVPTGLPIFSLYHKQRLPTAAMAAQLDTFVVDLQLTGTRIYTFKYTLAAVLRAAAAYGKQVVVLDRPNPLGGEILEGRVLHADVRSFVGEFALPMRHGLTMGEAARFFNSEIGAELTVVALRGWQPECLWSDLARPWVLTSPNMPTCETVFAFPGLVLLEGTNVSEGRGTCLPFQLLGAPWIADAERLVQRVYDLCPNLEGVHLRATQFMPTHQKWQGQVCNGLQLHITVPERARVFRLGSAVVRAFIELGEENFQWQQPPYEYEYERLPIQLLLGDAAADRMFTADNFDVDADYWHHGLAQYRLAAAPHLLYDRQVWGVD